MNSNLQMRVVRGNIVHKTKKTFFFEKYFLLEYPIVFGKYSHVLQIRGKINLLYVLWKEYALKTHTKQDLLKFLPDVDEKKIRVIYNGVSDEYYPLLNINNYKLPYPVNSYLLFVGERKAYKNFDLVVKSLKYLTYKLVIVGAELEKEEQKLLDKNLSSDNYCHVGRISNYDLNILYNGAVALIYPSSYEGFGLPVIEAQKAGCPVIAYNSSSISEIIGETPLLMHRLDLQELLKKVNMLSDLELRKDVIEKGIQNAKRFSWDDMYRKLIDLYLEAYDNNKKA